jgi:hypothetical protein
MTSRPARIAAYAELLESLADRDDRPIDAGDLLHTGRAYGLETIGDGDPDEIGAGFVRAPRHVTAQL